MNKICVIGLGYVGLPLAYAFAKKGYDVIGFDIDNSRINELTNNFDRTCELEKVRTNLKYSSDKDDIKN